MTNEKKENEYIVCQWVLGKCPMFHNLIFNNIDKAIEFVINEGLEGRSTIYRLEHEELP